MKQRIFAGSSNNLDNAATEYQSLNAAGSDAWDNSEGDVSGLVTTGGTFRDLYVQLETAPGAGNSFAFALMVNGAPSDLVVTISDTATSNNNVADEISVSAGDEVSLRAVPSSTPSTGDAHWNIEFEGDTANESLILGCAGGSGPAGGGQPSNVNISGENVPDTGEADRGQVISTGGTIKNLYIKLETPPDVLIEDDGWKFTLRKGTVGSRSDTALTVSIINLELTGNDTANDITVAAGDVVSMRIEHIGTPAGTGDINWGFTFVADTDGESLVLGGTDDDTANDNSTEYQSLSGSDETWTATEGNPEQLMPDCVLKNFYMDLESTPSATDTMTFTVRQDQTDTDLEIVFTDADTSLSNTSDTVTFTQGEEASLQMVPVGTPGGEKTYWGFTQFIAPPTGAWTPGTLYVNINDVWRPTTAYVNIGDVWTPLTEINFTQV